MTLTPEGGAAIPVSVTTTRKVQGGAAIPVYGYMTAPTDGRPAMGGSAIPVRVLTAADLKQNGGMWTLEGRPHAMPVYTAPATTTVMGGPAIAVYPVNAWPTVPVVPPVVTPWYLSGGIAAANCVAAYKAKGAASLAASYSNLANPGTNDAAPGVAPTFNAATGWTFDGATQYLGTGIAVLIDQSYSMFIQFSGGINGLKAIAGHFGSANNSFLIYPSDTTCAYRNGGPILAEGAGLTAGNVGMAGAKGYRNGVATTGNIPAGPGGANTLEVYIAAVNVADSPVQFWSGTISAMAIYGTVLTAPQIAALTTAMAAF